MRRPAVTLGRIFGRLLMAAIGTCEGRRVHGGAVRRGGLGGLCLLVAAGSWARAQPPSVNIHPRPVINIPWAVIPPTLDGRLEDAAWREADRIPLRAADGMSLGEAFLTADTDRLYAAVRVVGDTSDLKASARGHDSNRIEDDDRIEVLIDSFLDARNYFRLVVNSANRTLDERVIGGTLPDVGWEPQWASATRVDGGEWIAELAVPWLSLDARGVAGLVFGLDIIARSTAGPVETGSLTGDGGRDPTRFAVAGLEVMGESESLRLHLDRIDSADGGNWSFMLIGRNRQEEAERFWLDYRFGGPNLKLQQGVQGFDIQPHENYPVNIGPLSAIEPGPYSFVAVARKLGRGGGIAAMVAVSIE